MKTQSLPLVLLALVILLPQVLLAEPEEVSDPLEPVNRAIFWFNDQVDYLFLEPLAEGYDFIMPEFAQDGVRNFFDNLRYPSVFVSSLLQGKFEQAGEQTGRFLLNSTLGIGGLVDVADDFGLERHREDFGITLAYHDIPAGPYLVLPFLGPSNLRDGVGRVADSFLDPIYHLGWIADMDDEDVWVVSVSSRALDVLQTRTDLLEAVKAGKESSLDYYLFVQSAYYQHRAGVLNDAGDFQKADPFADDDIFDDEPFEDDLLEENGG